MAESFQALLVLPDEYKLHGGNYFAWKFRVKNILVLRNSWSIVDGEEQRPDGMGMGINKKPTMTETEKLWQSLHYPFQIMLFPTCNVQRLPKKLGMP